MGIQKKGEINMNREEAYESIEIYKLMIKLRENRPKEYKIIREAIRKRHYKANKTKYTQKINL